MVSVYQHALLAGTRTMKGLFYKFLVHFMPLFSQTSTNISWPCHNQSNSGIQFISPLELDRRSSFLVPSLASSSTITRQRFRTLLSLPLHLPVANHLSSRAVTTQHRASRTDLTIPAAFSTSPRFASNQQTAYSSSQHLITGNQPRRHHVTLAAESLHRISLAL